MLKNRLSVNTKLLKIIETNKTFFLTNFFVNSIIFSYLCENINKMKSRGIAIILAFLLGSFGIHRFYLGQIGYGLVYLLLSITGISTIIAIIDFILFLIMSEQEFNRKYN